MMRGRRVIVVVGLVSLLGVIPAAAQNADSTAASTEAGDAVVVASQGGARCANALGAKPAAGAGQSVVGVFFTCPEGLLVTEPVVRSWRLVPSGTQSEVLATTIEQLLAGPTPKDAAAGLGSWFSSATADQLLSASIAPDGSATVDFDPDLRTIIPGASSSSGSGQLLREIDATVFQFSGVTSATYAFGGSCDAFFGFLQFGGCPVRIPTIFVSNRIASGRADYVVVSFFDPEDQVIVGDFDGDGTDGFGIRLGNTYLPGDEFGALSENISYGKSSDDVYVGDWDNNGTDTLAVRRGNVFYLRNRPGSGKADIVSGYGRAGDEMLVGDWNGNSQDTFAVRRGNIFYLRNDLRSGVAQIVFAYGRAGDEVLVGDWDGDGRDTFAVRRGKMIFIRNDFLPGPAETVIGYGKSSDQLLVGDWNNDGVDTFAARRPPP